MKDQTKIKIRTAVADYFRMFPEDWEACKVEISIQRQGLDHELASIKGTHAIRRALFTIPEKLSAMIAKKLNDNELLQFKEKESGRWFAKEFKQFSITKEV